MITCSLDPKSYFENLVELAKQDLSTAHVFQHTTTADLVASMFQISSQDPGAFSTEKKLDTVTIHNDQLTGSKLWVSNIPNVKWLICQVGNKVVYVELDTSTQCEMILSTGMENTLTGHVTFNFTPCKILCNIDDQNYFVVRRIHALSFIAVHIGLCQSLYQNLCYLSNTEYNVSKLKLQLDVLQLLWDQIDKNVTVDHTSHYYWNQKNTVYAFAKKCLIEICQFIIETNSSSLFLTSDPANQKFKDALLYWTHMKNLGSWIKK
jgi:hypothetical protein